MKTTVENILPKEYTIRAPSMEDAEAATALINACELAEFGEAESTVEDLRTDWESPGLELSGDVWLVIRHGSQPTGYALLFNRADVRYHIDAYVHPEHWGRGIGTQLLRLAERRARQRMLEAPAGARVTLVNGVISTNRAAHGLMQHEGFSLARHFWRMRIDMGELPPTPKLHNGLTIRKYVPDQDERAVFETMNEAFRDHWGYLPWRFETWRQRLIEREDFDPDLWFLAMDGDEIAGGSLCHAYPSEGWVDQLAVRRPWRRQGLGLALLRHSFRAFYRRGHRRVALGVDSQNTTGATHLYERAGMHIAWGFDSYEEVLREGKPLDSTGNALLEGVAGTKEGGSL